MNEKEKDYILDYYGEFYNEECGPWNTPLKSKWYDYVENEYFEDNFNIKNVLNVCNIGIGSGVWDRYLSYHINKNSKLVCVDIDKEITETFRLCLINEKNNRNIEIINKDIFKYEPLIKFDLITVIGSAIQEIGFYNDLFYKVFSMLNDNGCLFYS